MASTPITDEVTTIRSSRDTCIDLTEKSIDVATAIAALINYSIFKGVSCDGWELAEVEYMNPDVVGSHYPEVRNSSGHLGSIKLGDHIIRLNVVWTPGSYLTVGGFNKACGDEAAAQRVIDQQSSMQIPWALGFIPVDHEVPPEVQANKEGAPLQHHVPSELPRGNKTRREGRRNFRGQGRLMR
jgi:hypothetical protein